MERPDPAVLLAHSVRPPLAGSGAMRATQRTLGWLQGWSGELCPLGHLACFSGCWGVQAPVD